MTKLRGVIFDLGGTLLDYHPPGGDWRSMEELGASGWYAHLQARGHPLPDEATVKQTVWEEVSGAWRRFGEGKPTNLAEMALIRLLGRAAHRLGLALTPEDARDAERAFIEAVQTIVRPLPGAAELLAGLRARGLRLGLISNTMWPGAYHEADLARFGLREPFEVLFFSSDERVWKPDPEIFRRAARALGLTPEEAAFIGDSRTMDVMGAQRAGLRGVWIENSDPYLSEGLHITPDATIRRLLDLLPLVDAWRDDRLT